MVPVMWILWKLVLSADRLHQWKYSENFPPPTQSDHNFASFAFFTALLTPLLIGLLAGIIAHYRKCQAYWPVIETVIAASVYLMFIVGMFTLPEVMLSGLAGAYLLMGGVIAAVLINTGACVHQRKWGKFANSVVVLIGGMLFLYWLNAFIIYVDT